MAALHEPENGVFPRRGPSAFIAAVLLGPLLFLAALRGSGNADTVSEYRVKAAFLFNFSKFVRWPEEDVGPADGAIYVCVIGENPFGKALDGINGKSVGDKMTYVRFLEDLEDPLDRCHILFIKTDRINTGRILERVRGRPVLTVGDEEGFVRAGGVIELFNAGKRIRFSANPEAAREGGLEVSSHLLKLAVPERERTE